MIDSDDNDDNNANRNGKTTNQIATNGTTHAASSSSTSGIATTTTTATTTTASITPTVCMSEEDRRAMDVLSDVLIQACMAMFVTSLGLRTVRNPPPPPPLSFPSLSLVQSLLDILCSFLICTTFRYL